MTDKGRLSPIQKPRTKEELELEIKREESKRFIKEKFYPAVAAATQSVDEATALLQAAGELIMGEAMQVMKTMKIKDVKNIIVRKLAPNDERLLEIETLIGIFDEKTLFDARVDLQHMQSLIEQVKIDMARSKKLSDIDVPWDKYLQK